LPRQRTQFSIAPRKDGRRSYRVSLGRQGACSAAAAVVVVLLLLLSASTAGTQDVTEPSLKAAYIYNFAKFTDWPLESLPATAVFTACVVGDGPVSDALVRALKGRQLGGRMMNVLHMEVDGPVRSCHLLYVAGITVPEASAILSAARGTAVLTISDMDDFIRLGGITHMFVAQGKIRFEFNLDLARRSKLQLSSQLLALAAHVYDSPVAGAR
jgi:YfiR/HmsC-like